MKKLLWLTLCLIFVFHNQCLAQKNVTLANETSWAPYYGKDLHKGGYIAEVIRQAFKTVGYDLKIKWMPWKRALVSAEKGVVDGLGGAYYTEERAKKFLYSDSFESTQVVFCKMKDNPVKYEKIEDLKGYKIGIGRGYGLPEIIKNADYLSFDEAVNFEQNMKKLHRKRIDLLINSKMIILDMINKKFPHLKDKIEFIGKPLEEETIHIVISKKIPNGQTIINDFNKGLKIIEQNGYLKKIKDEFGF